MNDLKVFWVSIIIFLIALFPVGMSNLFELNILLFYAKLIFISVVIFYVAFLIEKLLKRLQILEKFSKPLSFLVLIIVLSLLLATPLHTKIFSLFYYMTIYPGSVGGMFAGALIVAQFYLILAIGLVVSSINSISNQTIKKILNVLLLLVVLSVIIFSFTFSIESYKEYKAKVLVESAKNTQNEALCDELYNNPYYSGLNSGFKKVYSVICYESIALAKKDINICDKQTDVDNIERCKGYVEYHLRKQGEWAEPEPTTQIVDGRAIPPPLSPPSLSAPW